MRRSVILATAALALAATPAVTLAGGQGAAKDCGSIVVTTAKPSWIRTYSTWKLNSFAPTTGKLISCSTVKQVANNYLSTGKASGYTVMAFKGLKGRNLYKGDPSAKIGFQLFQ
jgi:hypothetical protein